MDIPELIIGNKNYSSWSLRPWFFLRKNGIQFSSKKLWLDEPAFRIDIAHYASGGKVPVLLDSGLEVWDSLAIIEYAIDRFACEVGWPDDRALRAHARSTVCEMHSSFTALRTQCPMDVRGHHDIDLSEATLADLRRISAIWTQALQMSGNQGRWLYGDFSVADAMFAPVVFRLSGYGISTSPLIQAYIRFVLADNVLAEWIKDAREETHDIDL